MLKAQFISRVLGWGGGRGLANRFTHGVWIELHPGAVYFTSPTDPDACIQALTSRPEQTEEVGRLR